MTDEEYNAAIDDEPIKVEEPLKVADGEYAFTIVDVRRRKEPYDYTDYVVRLDKYPNMPELKFGYPTNLSQGGAHFQFLSQFKTDMKLNEEYSINKIKEFMIGKKLKGYIKNTAGKKDPKRKFANIVSETVSAVEGASIAPTEPAQPTQPAA